MGSVLDDVGGCSDIADVTFNTDDSTPINGNTNLCAYQNP